MFKRISRRSRSRTRNLMRGRNLYRLLFSGVILAMAAIAALAFWGVHEVRRDAASVAVESSARGLSGAVTVLVNAVSASNIDLTGKDFGSLEPAHLRDVFAAILEKHAVLASAMVSDGDGLRYMLTRRRGGLLEGVAATGAQGDPSSDLRWTLWTSDGNSRPTQARGRYDKAAVDAVLADEFRQLAPGQVRWRSTDRLLDAGESWITASSLAESRGRKIMLSFILPVNAVVSQLVGAEKGRAEKVFLSWASGSILSIGDGAVIAGPGQTRVPQPVGSVTDPVIARAAELLAADASLRSVPVSMRVAGETWWVYLMPLSVFEDSMSLGVAVPMKSVVPAMGSDTFLQFFGGGLVLLAACALFLLRRYRARIETLGMRHGAARTAQDVLSLIAEGECSVLEFKQTMRFNLKAGKNGKEIEHAIVKTVAAFMNSEGGMLLIGVADDGMVTGFGEDNFASDDKALLHLNNLVNQYVGAEFSRYVDTMVIEVNGRPVIRVLCTPASAPAILKTGQSEEFYVRSGPASRQLTLSQFYEWLQNH
ncbi:MAG: ATP-binding protein [Pseudodesulfovibrio sp.]|uniref:AAA-4 family protein n=1 Tax=Pseudodesulfovibrio aespoeensis (strain ATCC 700646 / DSM 10631 / Aspo-2) TaxID=643562 RepID=E6VUM4_PSEA9|nr:MULTISPECIES: ATP-binding protein [Pseudodesulfovibrio]MBU4193284.1 ATP-binding protein [Pseudomonadota bacterium]ADU62265.1 AAA-4 family protein [Pseudodesulfovibrio aespoeensis Aspo-2]MBU4243315.1 ATP-binding protein [Pseudomonadota bacterium]MBU4380481.1 ATP-binding protein [Pseudomonadota bacterium]MBU4515268.1 ATP-binding protein [Pseudomonadota bacterium]